MSTEIKPGQEGRAVRDTHSAGGTLVPQSEVVTVDALCGEPHLFVGTGAGRTGMTLRVEDFLFAPTYDEATPAPLDPSKVKAGDTVTVEVQRIGGKPGHTVIGEAYEHHSGEIYVGGWPVDYDKVTLTDHQPAPEPEPEWKPGTVAEVTNRVGEVSRAMWTGVGVWVDATRGEDYHGDSFADVRPLVVIDPAEVDKNELALLIDGARHEGMWAQVALVLNFFGIEAS